MRELWRWGSAFLLFYIGMTAIDAAHDYRESVRTERYRAKFARAIAHPFPPKSSFLRRCLGQYLSLREYVRDEDRCGCVNDVLQSLGYLKYEDGKAMLIQTTILFYEDGSVADVIDNEYLSRGIDDIARNGIFEQIASRAATLCPQSIGREEFANLYVR